jgi:hypothetical protein
MHTTCFDQHRSSSGVSKIADETAVILVYVPVCPTMERAVHLLRNCIETAVFEYFGTWCNCSGDDIGWWQKRVEKRHGTEQKQ